VYVAGRPEWYDDGALLGLSTAAWVWFTVAEAVAHKMYVWLCWRRELHAGLLSRAFGRSAFGIYAAGVTILILARPFLVTAVAAKYLVGFLVVWAGRGTPGSPTACRAGRSEPGSACGQ